MTWDGDLLMISPSWGAAWIETLSYCHGAHTLRPLHKNVWLSVDLLIEILANALSYKGTGYPEIRP
jgi:hypothetical protein